MKNYNPVSSTCTLLQRLFVVLAASFCVLSYGATIAATQHFDLSDASDQLWTPREVNLYQGKVMQSFAFDTTHQTIFAVQLTTGSASDSGNLTVTKLSWDGQTVLGHMFLTGFGHGVQIGVEPSGTDTYLWTEVDGVVSGSDSWGNKIGRFKFVNGTTLASSSTSISKYTLVPSSDRTTCNVDMVYNRLILRYRVGSTFHYRLFDLTSVKNRTVDTSGVPVYLLDVTQPSGLGTFQGFTSYGSYLYLLTGDCYSTDNPSPGNTNITAVNLLSPSTPDTQQTNAGTTLTYREPEGMAVWKSGTSVRLCFGFATQTTEGARKACVYYKDALIGP